MWKNQSWTRIPYSAARMSQKRGTVWKRRRPWNNSKGTLLHSSSSFLSLSIKHSWGKVCHTSSFLSRFTERKPGGINNTFKAVLPQRFTPQVWRVRAQKCRSAGWNQWQKKKKSFLCCCSVMVLSSLYNTVILQQIKTHFKKNLLKHLKVLVSFNETDSCKVGPLILASICLYLLSLIKIQFVFLFMEATLDSV